jgi:hypothetical protein
MKNSFKFFFLLTSLFSAVTSVFNSSLPLSETDLTMDYNSSVTERRGLIAPYGGSRVIGYTHTDRLECERTCTVSFPASYTRGTGLGGQGIEFVKGFLFSSICANSNVFVIDPHTANIGISGTPSAYKPRFGLEYAFLEIYSDYWDSVKSHYVAFDEMLNYGRFDLLAMIEPTKPPFTGITVCAYGGKSDLACGVIMDFDVTITVNVPGSCAKKTEKFFHVTKVLMNKNYRRADLGAPVYIAEQIPFDSQLVVAPVGMVVENVDSNQEPNA